MKLERFEVRLRPKNPAEKALIDALDSQDGIYGGKNELMRECLCRGYMTLKQKMESLANSGDEMTTLDVLAQTFANGEYGYRVVKTYLNVRDQVKAEAGGHPEPEREAGTGAEPPLAAVSASQMQQQDVQAVLDTVVADVIPAREPASLAERDLAGNVDEGVPKPKMDWSRLRGLAASGGSGISELSEP